jgi:hypothetical protein
MAFRIRTGQQLSSVDTPDCPYCNVTLRNNLSKLANSDLSVRVSGSDLKREAWKWTHAGKPFTKCVHSRHFQ